MRRLDLIPVAGVLVLAALFVPLTHADGGPAVTVYAAATQFTPEALVVPAGTEVQWEATLFHHTVTTSESAVDMANGDANDPLNADGDADSFRAGLSQGTTFTHVFENPGVYYYFCEPHVRLGMWGVIEVVG